VLCYIHFFNISRCIVVKLFFSFLFQDTNILNLIELPLLTNGYQFVVVTGSSVFAGNSDRTVAYHRNCARTRSEAVCLLQELEPDLYAHSNIVEAIYNRSIGNSSFSDGTTKWFVTYYPISSTSSSEGNDGLSVVGIVPYGDIEENYVHLKTFMKSWGEYSLIAVACVVVIIFFIMIKLSSFFFKTLINPLHEFNSQAATDFNEGELDEELGNTSRSISFKYKAMEKVKSSFQSLIFILEDVNHQYFCGRFDVAYDQVLLLEHIFQEMENEPGIGVILNNKGSILLKLFEVEDNVKKAHDCFKESIRIGLKVVEDFSKIVDEKKKTDAAFRFHTLTLAGRYCNLGNYYQLVHDYEAALRVYDMSVGLYTQAGDIVGKARATGMRLNCLQSSSW
jgi:tetratricopeptide (TPR) repeat protein